LPHYWGGFDFVAAFSDAGSAGGGGNEHRQDAVCATYVLVAIVRKRLNLEASLYTILQIVSVPVFEKIPLRTAFSSETYDCDTDIENN
jgi:hypothetical protein